MLQSHLHKKTPYHCRGTYQRYLYSIIPVQKQFFFSDQETRKDGHPLFQTNQPSLRPSHAARGSWIQSPKNNQKHHIPARRDPNPNCCFPRPHTDHAACADHHYEPRP